ncbi:hypothetical protein OH799_18165 [Nocardia sp. NBC_00881]|uniref:hypothetical protein n=1 Tax=Nocardia sp. NBC_00881 TaxID=2975995 RepID=UPI0038662110|nr:hypothetical protein OH799_18165 [Nocardia sp. NBC_00881]
MSISLDGADVVVTAVGDHPGGVALAVYGIGVITARVMYKHVESTCRQHISLVHADGDLWERDRHAGTARLSDASGSVVSRVPSMVLPSNPIVHPLPDNAGAQPHPHITYLVEGVAAPGVAACGSSHPTAFGQPDPAAP